MITGEDRAIVYDSGPPKNARNPLLYIWATEDIRITDPFFYQKIDIFEKGQIYTAKLTITDSNTVTSSDQMLTATFGRTTATDGQCAKTLSDFLASVGITYQTTSTDDSTGNNSSAAAGNQTASPKTSGSANQAAQGRVNRTPLEAYLGTIFNQPVLTLGDRVVRGASLIWWLFELLVLAATSLGIYFFVKRRRLWGVVYDGRSKDPIEMAVVRLFDQEHHKLLETRVTPKSGRYSFLAEPGAYYLDVTKEGYHFPSRIVTSTIDNEYSNLYRGEIIKLGVGQSLVAPDVPIDSEAGEIKTASFYRRRVFPWLDKLRLPILLLAILLTPVVYLARQSGEIASSYLLPVGTMLLVIFLISEFLFVRRGRK